MRVNSPASLLAGGAAGGLELPKTRENSLSPGDPAAGGIAAAGGIIGAPADGIGADAAGAKRGVCAGGAGGAGACAPPPNIFVNSPGSAAEAAGMGLGPGTAGAGVAGLNCAGGGAEGGGAEGGGAEAGCAAGDGIGPGRSCALAGKSADISMVFVSTASGDKGTDGAAGGGAALVIGIAASHPGNPAKSSTTGVTT